MAKIIVFFLFVGSIIAGSIACGNLISYLYLLKYTETSAHEIDNDDINYKITKIKPCKDPWWNKKVKIHLNNNNSRPFDFSLRTIYSIEKCTLFGCDKINERRLYNSYNDFIKNGYYHGFLWETKVENLEMCDASTESNKYSDKISIESIPTEELGEPVIYRFDSGDSIYIMGSNEMNQQDEDGYLYVKNGNDGYYRIRLLYIPYRELGDVTLFRLRGDSKEFVKVGRISVKEMLWLSYGRTIVLSFVFCVFFLISIVIFAIIIKNNKRMQ